jgi:hypothetical protein
MKKYENKSDISGVVAYEIDEDRIRVLFKDNDTVYTYSYRSAGQQHVEIMKALAKKGIGLSTYISQHVHDKYEV